MTTPAGSGRHLGTPQTTVYKVTNLNSSGPGSLREALEAEGPRVVVFEVSGNIDCTPYERLSIDNPYITVAGQTAPSPGITLKGCELNVSASDVLLQHIRIRVDDLNDPSQGSNQWSERDSMKVGGDRVVIDHSSFSWATDENVQTRGNSLTFRHNIISEGLHSPLHDKGPHSRGLLMMNQGASGTRNEGQNLAVIGNLFAHNMARNPTVNGGATAVGANNLVYSVNVGPKASDDGERLFVSYMNNVVKETFKPYYFVVYTVNPQTRVYLGTHLLDDQTYTYPDIWEEVGMGFGIVPDINRASSPPISVPGLVLKPVDEVEAWVLANAGARPIDRDPVDARIINDVKNGTGGIIVSQDDVGGWPDLSENYRAFDIPANPNEIQPSGYTALEELLHAYACEVEGGTDCGAPLTLHGTPADQAIYLDWEVNTTIPITSTWQISYDGPTGDQTSPITGMLEPTRAYTLTGLTNYTSYAITLNAMLDSTPILTDTVTVMPTDRFSYLPLITK